MKEKIRGPNKEQIAAIEHNGGVLLNAGAGSGKTFVLVEHIIYLIEQFNKENCQLLEVDYTKKLKSFLSSIVVMTFTKKAAGELEVRLFKRINQHAQLKAENNWEIIKKNYLLINVGTIHSFCHKLLSGGLIAQYNPNIEIVSDNVYKKKIETLFTNWFEKNSTKSNEFGNIFDTFLSNKDSVLEALYHVFLNPGLRQMWDDYDKNSTYNDNLAIYFKEYLSILGLWSLFTDDIEHLLNNFATDNKKKWFQYLQQFNSNVRNITLSDESSYQQYLDFFDSFKGARTPKLTEFNIEIVNLMGKLKILKKFLNDNTENFMAFFRHKNEFQSWSKLFHEIFCYIDDHYLDITGFTFSDLEYYVLQALKDEHTSARVANNYKYYIVDEFQDTSNIQFEIIKRLINNDFKNLFCVGDVQQAIYGFRGGELGVFKKCQKAVPLNLSLKNNYRSGSSIITFNNSLFKNIFNKGNGFKGVDEYAVDAVIQNSPTSHDPDINCVVQKVAADIVDDQAKGIDKLSTAEINTLEAVAIVDQIKAKQVIIGDNGEVICILYKKLNPTQYLIPLLLENKIDFSAQIKIPFSHDPIIGIFKLLIDAQLEQSNSLKFTQVAIKCYLEFLKIEVDQINLEGLISQYINDILLIGMKTAFRRFLYALNISNSNYSNNMEIVESICDLAMDDPCEVYAILAKNSDSQYTVDFQNGTNASKVLIMTTHASKGLEFDHVIIGGIHTNGSALTSGSYFGKIPQSYKWKVNAGQKKPYKSPQYLLEGLISKKKDFSETKRLFYVACTRAKKCLTWIDMSYLNKPVVFGENSWINGLRSFENSITSDKIFKVTSVQICRDHDNSSTVNMKNSIPLFHKDNLGIESKTCRNGANPSLAIMSELSVTRLASICDCMRKFYLQNICKIDFDEIELLEELSQKQNNQNKQIEHESVEVATGGGVHSSANRGTKLHKVISELITSNWKIPPYITDPQDINALYWVLNKLKMYREDYDLISEQQVKFPLFGHMVSGTPDLLLRPKNCQEKKLVIYDFKTGQRDEQHEDSYWFQVFCYGHYCYESGLVKESDPIDVVLAYIDESKLCHKEIDFGKLSTFFKDHWSKLIDLSSVNKTHCPKCQFAIICNS
ncbi:MAG: UvrD-helicase domain-containing protein [Bacteriovoracaceae bacterium]|nr:UvrD-helicase domain-containing protein [Bacteriovoracaceae bacterium]